MKIKCRLFIVRYQQSSNYSFEQAKFFYIILHISRRNFLTVEEAVAAIGDPEYRNDDLDVVLAPPDVAVASDEEGLMKTI